MIGQWPSSASVVVLRGNDVVATAGDIDHPFALASLTKLISAMAVLVAHEEGTVDLDEPATPAGATVGDLLAHAGGVAPDDRSPLSAPRTRRIYSTAAYDTVADLVASRAAMPFWDYVHEAVHEPLGMVTHDLAGSAGAGATGSTGDLVELVSAWRTPRLIAQHTLDRSRTPHLPGLDGVLPGYGRQSPNPWGLGPEIKGPKAPHWTSPLNNEQTFGHFGQSGTMLWIDPQLDLSVISLCTTPFGPWAIDAWPALSTSVITAVAG